MHLSINLEKSPPFAPRYAVVPLLSLEKLTRSDEGGGKHHVNDAEDIGDESDEGGGDAPGGGTSWFFVCDNGA